MRGCKKVGDQPAGFEPALEAPNLAPQVASLAMEMTSYDRGLANHIGRIPAYVIPLG